MTHQLASLSSCLFDAFANQDSNNPQADRQIWAIVEGFKRMYHRNSLIDIAWEARKEHTCVRGCLIKQGDTYFKYSYDTSVTGYIKICAGCFAQVLYFFGVDRMEPVLHTHWDEESQQAVLIGKVKSHDFQKYSPGDHLLRKE